MSDASSHMNIRNLLFGAALFTATAAAAEEVPFRDMPLEQRVCPDVTQNDDLGAGKVIKKSSSQFCYSEPHADSVMLFPRTNVQVFYEEEGTQKKDAWSGPNGYTKIVRQLLVRYDLGSTNYEIEFITSPHADGKGLYDREGSELLYLTRIEDGKRMKNDFTYHHGQIGSYVSGKEENVWKENGIIEKVKSLMAYLQEKTYQAAKRLKQYRLTFEPATEKDESPQILSDEEIWKITERTEKIYKHAKYKDQ